MSSSLIKNGKLSEQALDAQSAAFLKAAYHDIHFIRIFEQQCWDMTAPGNAVIDGSVHLCAGQEAVPVGARAGLGADDLVVSTYRGHGWALQFGVTAYEAMSEICHRRDGINGGRAGSAMMMAPERGFIGENSIVGAGVPIAAGVAMAEKLRGTGSIALVSFGDGATSQGALHEGMVFAAAKKLPVIFLLENNGWSEMTPSSSMMPVERLASRASSYGMKGASIDGTDPMAVRDTIAIAAAGLRDGAGPCLIECRVPRLWGHYNRDIEHYRPKEDRADAEARDPLVTLEARLIAGGAADAAGLEAIRADNQEKLAEITERAQNCSRPEPGTARLHIVAQPESGVEAAVPANATKRETTYIEAVNAALRADLETRSDTLVYGEDCGKAGGIFGATRNLQREFGQDRVFDTPIAESAILGSAIGAAMRGMRPIVEIMWADFMLVALDQVINQAANIRYVSQGKASAPLVIRTQQGVTPGSCAQHSQSLEALLAHIPGLKLGMPAFAEDAYAMLRAATADPDPVLLIESRALYQTKGLVDATQPVQAVGGAAWRRSGGDLSIISWGPGVHKALEAADALAAEGIAAGVLDLRWLSPLDDAALEEAVLRGGGRVMVLHEANRTGGFGAEIAARIAEDHGSKLTAPIRRLGALDSRIPAAPNLQAILLPQAAQVAETAKQFFDRG